MGILDTSNSNGPMQQPGGVHHLPMRVTPVRGVYQLWVFSGDADDVHDGKHARALMGKTCVEHIFGLCCVERWPLKGHHKKGKALQKACSA